MARAGAQVAVEETAGLTVRPGTIYAQPRSRQGRDRGAERIGMPEITFHGLRHTHASQLIASGVDIVTISKRLGHAKPSVTLAIYAHMFHIDDSRAAAAINAALG